MIDHNKIRNITSDIYNNFYSRVKDLDNSDHSWQIRIDIGTEIMNKYNKDRFCVELVNVYLDEMERGFK